MLLLLISISTSLPKSSVVVVFVEELSSFSVADFLHSVDDAKGGMWGLLPTKQGVLKATGAVITGTITAGMLLR